MSQQEKITFDKFVMLLTVFTIDTNGHPFDLETGARWLWDLGFINRERVSGPTNTQSDSTIRYELKKQIAKKTTGRNSVQN